MTDSSEQHSLLITTCDRYAFLERQIDTIARMNPLPNQVIIVDDTPKNKRKNLKQKLAALDDLDMDCQLIQTEGKKGANYCRNLAILKASSDYVTLLDDDDFLSHDYFHHMPVSVLTDKKAAIYGSKFFVESSDLSKVMRKKIAAKSSISISDLVKKNHVGGTSGVSFYKQSLIENDMLFREDMPALQDYEFWLRLAAKGFEFIGAPNCIVYYTVHVDNGQVSRNPQKYKMAIEMLGKADNLDLTLSQLVTLKFSLRFTRLKSIIRSKLPALEKLWFRMNSTDKRRHY